jgi:nitroreductase
LSSSAPEIALQAPNETNLRPRHFVAVTDPACKQALADGFCDAHAE